jgi:hypothetical protein
MAAMEAYGNIWLLRSDGASPENWTKIANVKSFDGPNEETAFNDATDFDSPGGKREWRPGLTDGGALDLTVNFKPGETGWGALRTQQRQKKKAKFRLVTCDADEGTRECEEFEAFVQTRGRGAEVDGLMEGRVSFKITGDTDETAPAYPEIAVSVSPTSLTEGGSPSSATFTIELSHVDGKDTEISLSWSGSATVDSDYTRPATASVTIPAGETSATIGPVTILNEVTVESAETVILTIDPEIDGHTLTGTLSATLTLNSEDE